VTRAGKGNQKPAEKKGSQKGHVGTILGKVDDLDIITDSN
jgi:hypothetical protein